MVQVKKTEVKEAILEAAFDLFSRRGYVDTTMAHIARAANVTVANLYVYFDSKLLLLYEVYRPWLVAQMDNLGRSAEKYRTPRTRLRRILLGLWSDIPAADGRFANSLIEALAVAPRDTNKPGNMLQWAEERLTSMMLEILPADRRHVFDDRLIAHIIWMAFDGFVINYRLGDIRDTEAVADFMTDLILGEKKAS